MNRKVYGNRRFNAALTFTIVSAQIKILHIGISLKSIPTLSSLQFLSFQSEILHDIINNHSVLCSAIQPSPPPKVFNSIPFNKQKVTHTSLTFSFVLVVRTQHSNGTEDPHIHLIGLSASLYILTQSLKNIFIILSFFNFQHHLK